VQQPHDFVQAGVSRLQLYRTIRAAMPVRPCPACGEPTPHHLDESSKGASVDYYRCPNCNHIWTVDKLDLSKVTHVTPLPNGKRKRNS
jgi:ssDNA-binding Zn-finger/Zn-ribbon topoisomerase 1